MRPIYILTWNHKRYVTTDITEAIAFASFMGLLGATEMGTSLFIFDNIIKQ